MFFRPTPPLFSLSAIAHGKALAAAATFAASWLVACSPDLASSQTAPLVLDQTIPLPGVAGRIDHLALDQAGGRLFVAALGNRSVEVVDLIAGKTAGRISGLPEPQGLAVIPQRHEVAVATRGDGAVRFFRTDDLASVGQTPLGQDADNVRIDPVNGRVVVGFGDGGLAIIDPETRKIVGETRLPAHPEGFQLEGVRAYVNLPDAGVIAVADLNTGAILAKWSNGARRWNFPLAFDKERDEADVVYRLPARLVVLDANTGTERQALKTCGDADDLFLDARRDRIYVACGGGQVDVFARKGRRLERLARISTTSGARTALFDPERDRLYVAARSQGGKPAALLVLRPQ